MLLALEISAGRHSKGVRERTLYTRAQCPEKHGRVCIMIIIIIIGEIRESTDV